MAVYKVGAEGGGTVCQHQVGFMYYKGLGVDVDYAQALAWLEKAAAQDMPIAIGQLGVMYFDGTGVAPSWRRAREHYERAIELGFSTAVKNAQALTNSIQNVTSRRSKPFTCLHHSCAQPSLPHPPPSSLAYAQVAPLVDKRVELHGTSRADLDGKRGVATDFHYYKVAGSKCRYTVRLDGGEAFKVKLASVRAEGAGGGGGGGSGGGGDSGGDGGSGGCGGGGDGGGSVGADKAKGKGKKRRGKGK